MSVELSVVIPALSGSRGLSRLLKSLDQQSLRESFEVHVVFNPRPDKLAQHGLDESRFKIWTSQRGVNRARNFGVAQSRGRWIYFLDADCVLPNSDHLARLIEVLRTTPETVVCGGSYSLPSQSGRWSRTYHAIQDRWIQEGAHPGHGWVHLLGGNLAVSRSIFTTLRFDDDIVFGASETDFLARWFLRGGKAKFLPDLSVLHVHQLDRAQFMRKAFFQGYGYERLMSRGLVVKGPRRVLLGPNERRELRESMNLYAEVFALGRDFFARSPDSAPQNPKIRWQLLRSRLTGRWQYSTPFGAEIQRWLKLRAQNSDMPAPFRKSVRLL